MQALYVRDDFEQLILHQIHEVRVNYNPRPVRIFGQYITPSYVYLNSNGIEIAVFGPSKKNELARLLRIDLQRYIDEHSIKLVHFRSQFIDVLNGNRYNPHISASYIVTSLIPGFNIFNISTIVSSTFDIANSKATVLSRLLYDTRDIDGFQIPICGEENHEIYSRYSYAYSQIGGNRPTNINELLTEILMYKDLYLIACRNNDENSKAYNIIKFEELEFLARREYNLRLP